MMALMSPKVWIGIAFAALLALVGLQQVRVSVAKAATAEARATLASDRTAYAQAAQKAEADARAEETRREAAKQEVINHARNDTKKAEAAARDAADAAVGLRKRLAAYVAAIRAATADSSTPAGGKTADDPAGMLALVLGRLDDRAGLLAAYADSARIAGQACERAYDGLQPAAR